MEKKKRKIKGRGSIQNPKNRFAKTHYQKDAEGIDEPWDEEPSPKTQFLPDSSQSIITYNQSPDIPYEASLNPYRGCEHGCSYCYARPYHEYLGFSAGLDFETKIVVKEKAPELLRKELSAKGWEPKTLTMSGVTDPYQPIERKLEITRRCLEVLLDFRNPVCIITKNHLVTRDIDILSELAKFQAVKVFISITTLDRHLGRKLEPRTSTPERRLEAMSALTAEGIPVGLFAAPLIPGLTDHEGPAIAKAAAEAGAKWAWHTLVRLPGAVAEIFEQWLTENYPKHKKKVLHRVMEMRGGKLNEPSFGLRFNPQGILSQQVEKLFAVTAKKLGLNQEDFPLSISHFRNPKDKQMKLF